MKYLLIVMFMLSGCTAQKHWSATGGSRSDATVRLSYEYKGYESPVTSASEAISLARSRCRTWGYSSAEAFGGSTQTCSQAGGLNGCVMWVVTKEFQCTGDGSEIKRTTGSTSKAKSSAKPAAKPVGKYQYNAGELAKDHGCEPPTLLTQNPPVEMFQATCSGSHYVIKCEWNNCVVIR